MSPIEFRAPWSRRLKVTTAIATVILGLVIAWASVIGAHFGNVARLIFVGLPLLILVLSMLIMVRGYALTQDEIVVRRFGWVTRLPLNTLQAVEGKADAMNGSWKVLGNGGVFAFAGWFWNKQLGLYRAFATDHSRAVILRYSRHKVVITPHDPQHFIMRARTLLKTMAHRV